MGVQQHFVRKGEMQTWVFGMIRGKLSSSHTREWSLSEESVFIPDKSGRTDSFEAAWGLASIFCVMETA